jgi:hypothetical protein
MDPAGVVSELARRFQAGDGAGALHLFHPDFRGVARPDVEVHRHAEVLRDRVQRVPVRVGEVRQAVLVERRGPQHAPMTHLMAAA